MKNSTQTLLNPIQSFKSFVRAFGLMLVILVGFNSYGQNGLIGSGFGANDWSTTSNFDSGAGTSRIFTSVANGTGNQYFRLNMNWDSNYNQFGSSSSSNDYAITINTEVPSVELIENSTAKAYFIDVASTSDNYIFKTKEGGNPPANKGLVVFRVQGAVRTVNSVTQFPLAANAREYHATKVTAVLDGALASGQEVYLRYTKDGYASSVVVKLTGSGTSYTGTIPSSFHTSGANVSYYVFTSGTTNVATNGSNADLYTINFNTNGGSNYSYSVAAGGATTSVPDDNFEQALIDLGLDYTLDNSVFTSNISDITFLDIRNKNISNLVGIQDFTSLKFFYCSDNQISDLHIDGLTNLQELVTSNNPLTNTVLDLHFNPNLYYLFCENNGLTSLNISGLTNLDALSVWNNNLTSSIDVTASPNLKYLDCDDNAFTTINLSGLSKLEQFYCSGNALTTLDVRGLSSLANFVCTNNSALTCILVDDVADANLKTITLDPDPEAEVGSFLWAKDATANYSYCDCALTTTWNGSTWDNGAPTTGTFAAIISGNYSVASNINACSLTIAATATVVIPSGYNVTLNAPIIVETGGSFSLSNNANLIQTNKKSINSGAITVNRNSNPLYRLDYTMWSSPTGTSQKLNEFSPLTSIGRFYEYNPTSNLYNAVADATPFSQGKGFLIRMPNTDPTVGYDAGSATLAYPGVFTGIPNNGDVTVAGTAGKYVAVGNPYPSTISADAFIDANVTASGTLYYWRKTNIIGGGGTSYATYTKAGGIANGGFTPTSDIAVGQGFISTVPTSGTIAFTNALRTSSTTAQFLRTKAPAQKDRVWINLSAGTNPVNQILVVYMNGATTGVDNGIDGKYINDSATALTSNIDGGEYVIQGRPAFEASDIVALNFKTAKAGTFTIAKDHADGLFANGQAIYLVDATTGTETNLQTDGYTFTATAGVSNGRFSLKYQKTLGVNTVAFDENSISVYKHNGLLNINAGNTTMKNVKVFDIQGRLILEQKEVNATTTTLKNLIAGKQAILIQITSDDNRVVTKKAIN